MSDSVTPSTPLTYAKQFYATWPMGFNRVDGGMVVDATMAAALEAELLALKRDALRYQYLRSAKLTEMLALFPTSETCDVGLDYAIDQAMKATNGCCGKCECGHLDETLL